MLKECNTCGSKWESNMKVGECPFCGSSLNNTEDFSRIRNVIDYIITRNGITSIKNKRMVLSYIMDVYSGNDKIRKLFKIACEHGILEYYIDYIAIDNEIEKYNIVHKAIKELEEEAFLSYENSAMIVKEVFSCKIKKENINDDNLQRTENLSDYQHSDFEHSKTQSENMRPENIGINDSLDYLYEKALRYLDENSNLYDPLKGIDLLEKIADKDHVKAQVDLGLVYLKGEYNLDENKDLAYYWLTKSLEIYDNAYVKYCLTFILFSDGIHKNYLLGRQYLNEAVEANIARAKYRAAQYILTGLYGYEENDDRALELALSAAEQGDSEIEKFVGEIYLYIYEDIDKAVEWLEKSGSKENISAYIVLIELYWNIIHDEGKANYYYDKMSVLVHDNKKLLFQLSDEELEKINCIINEIENIKGDKKTE